MLSSSGSPTNCHIAIRTHIREHDTPSETVDSFRRSIVRNTGVSQAYRPIIATGVFAHHFGGEAPTYACPNHSTVSVHASALFRSSRFGCVDCQERTDPLATYGRTSSIATSFRGNTVRRTRTVVLAWLFRRHAITKPTYHASISLSL